MGSVEVGRIARNQTLHVCCALTCVVLIMSNCMLNSGIALKHQFMSIFLYSQAMPWCMPSHRTGAEVCYLQLINGLRLKITYRCQLFPSNIYFSKDLSKESDAMWFVI